MTESRETILATAARHGAGNVRVFGSVARGDADDLSDPDLLVDLDGDRSPMDMGGLLMELQAQLNTKADITTERMLRPDIRERVLSEAVLLSGDRRIRSEHRRSLRADSAVLPALASSSTV